MKFASGDSGAAHESDQHELMSLNLTEWNEYDERSSTLTDNSLCNADNQTPEAKVRKVLSMPAPSPRFISQETYGWRKIPLVSLK